MARRLLDKLYVGREHNMELSGAIAAVQNYAAGGMHGGQGQQGRQGQQGQHGGKKGSGIAAMAGLMPAPMMGSKGSVMMANPMMMMGGAQQQAMMGGGAASAVPKLPAVRTKSIMHDSSGGGANANGGAKSGGRSGRGQSLGQSGGGGTMLNPTAMGGGMMPLAMMQMEMAHHGYGYGGDAMGSPLGAHGAQYGGQFQQFQQQQSGSPMYGDGPYAHVQSKFAAHAAEAGQAGKKVAANAKGGKKKPDRFDEAQKDNSRMAAMAKRWN